MRVRVYAPCFFVVVGLNNLITRAHDMLSQSENTKYKHEYRLRTDDQISSFIVIIKLITQTA